MAVKAKDRIGQKFGTLTVVEVWRENKITYCRSSCDCGSNTKVSALNTLVGGDIKSCGCLPKKPKDITGKVNGRLKAISNTGVKSGNGDYIWLCSCICGGTTEVTIGNFNSGHTKSCGCLVGDLIRGRDNTHGMKDTNSYTSWRKMRERCNNPKDILYPKYGAVGITVCDRWGDSFSRFYQDMGPSPLNHTIDRIDLTKGYYPENCRWSSRYVQNRNKGSYLGTSKYKGVQLETSSNKWLATFSLGEIRSKKIGRYKNEDDAAKAYNLASILIFGEGNSFLHLNDVDTDYSSVNTNCKFFNYWVSELIKEKEKHYEDNPEYTITEVTI